MKLRHNPENINACYCSCHEGNGQWDFYGRTEIGSENDPACERCGILICPTCTQVIPKRLINTILTLDDAGRKPVSTI